MKILFLTNNKITYPLFRWLEEREEMDIVHNEIEELDADMYNMIISYNYKYIVPPRIIRKYKGRIINLHPSYLPWGRGAQPIFWAAVSGETPGVTIHFMDEGVDTGEIIVQEIYSNAGPQNKTMTMREVYNELQEQLQEMFKREWEMIKRKIGSYHSIRKFDRVKHILEPEGWDITVEELQRGCNELCIHSSTKRE